MNCIAENAKLQSQLEHLGDARLIPENIDLSRVGVDSTPARAWDDRLIRPGRAR